MAKIRYGKWGCWIPPLGVLFSLFAVVITASPPGFLSIRCGGKTNYTDENNITWVTDADYIDVGERADIGNATVQGRGSPLDSLRFFSKPLKKSCYQLPVPSNVPYLLRLWFITGNYSRFQTFPSFACSFETVDMLAMENIAAPTQGDAFYHEKIMATSGTVMYVCLIRTSQSDDPFVSGIELRPLRDGMYAQAKPGTMLYLGRRISTARNYSTLRYPGDNFDRIWEANITVDSSESNIIGHVSSEEPISTTNTKELPPTVLFQTAWVINSDILRFTPNVTAGQESKSLLLLYFAEIETLNMYESRSFYVVINEVTQPEIITLVRNYSALELVFVSNQFDNFTLKKAPNSTQRPIINALEYYWLIHTQPTTYPQDIDALVAIKRRFDIKAWISDPCYLIKWDGIGCQNHSSGIRISEIDLSGKNLTGFVPNDIAELTALVNVSLHNNQLMGSLPNFSNLVMLKRLYLQNNNLSGTLPVWLFELKNLKELNIENNSFNGVIPAKLLSCSLKLNYSGNPDLHLLNKRECTPHHSNKNNNILKVVGITLSGILIIALVLIAGVVVYLKKFRKKKRESPPGISGVGMELKPFLCQDYTRIMVPNSTKTRAFTLDEMVAATQTFSREIGRGGFGSVFFGKLPEGKDIAVKVLSLLSHQGVQEFLNELDLLSRINHRDLVSLLGYCNETREVMLIYDYMSGGSLRDHLYGTTAEHSELNWKTRLKVALDAAHGLEYLHEGSTPKIIHRDVKTANILLDSNMNGKLADFGLSRMTIDGEATHVTTAVKGTAGYLDPEYYSTQMLTEKSDVYSFGVVLLEIICGRPPIDLKLPVQELNIIRWATPYLTEMDENAGKIREIIDIRLGGSYNMKSITRVFKVAMRCVRPEPSSRPSVSEVVAELKEAIKHEDIDFISISEEIDMKCVQSEPCCRSNVSEIVAAELKEAIKHEDVASISIPGEISMDLLASLQCSEPKGMEWSDNSSNISKVGR